MMRIERMKLRQKIAQAVDELFRNNMGEIADRLVLTVDVPGGKNRDLGGWNRAAVTALLCVALDTEK